MLIILAVLLDPQLHTPMYFFLSNLSLTDICISTTTIPKMLVNIQTENQSITYAGCLTQTASVLLFASLETCLLGVMAYDRYVAICHPLRYTVIMSPKLCGLLMVTSLLLSTMDALIHSLMVLRLFFCTNTEIPHFFCELAQVIKVACSDTFINDIMIYVSLVLFGGIPISGIAFSYAKIISAVSRMHSTQGKLKAFSTCGSHLLVVSLFYGTTFVAYISSAITESSWMTSLASVMYIVFPQMMNPFIYSLRNRDIKEVLRKHIGKAPYFLKL